MSAERVAMLLVIAALVLRVLIVPASTAASWSVDEKGLDGVVLEFIPKYPGRHYLVVHTSGACDGLPVASDAIAENGQRWLPIHSTWEIVREGQRLAGGMADKLALSQKGRMTILASERLDTGVSYRASVVFTSDAKLPDTCIERIAIAIDFHLDEKHLVDAIVDCLLLIVGGVLSIWTIRRWRLRKAKHSEAQDSQL